MPFIEIVPPKKADGELAEDYQYMGSVAGGFDQVAKIVQMFSLRAGSMRRMIETWEAIMWIGEEPRANRELVASMISRHNECHY